MVHQCFPFLNGELTILREENQIQHITSFNIFQLPFTCCASMYSLEKSLIFKIANNFGVPNTLWRYNVHFWVRPSPWLAICCRAYITYLQLITRVKLPNNRWSNWNQKDNSVRPFDVEPSQTVFFTLTEPFLYPSLRMIFQNTACRMLISIYQTQPNHST